MDIKVANLMLKFISKVCSNHRGLDIEKYTKCSGEKEYVLEWMDCG